MRTCMLICALAGLLLRTSGQTVFESSTTVTETPALRDSQSNTTETGPVTSATSDNQSNTTEKGPATSATSDSQSKTTEKGPATSATSDSQSNTTEKGPATSATSDSQSKTTEKGPVTSATSDNQSNTTEKGPATSATSDSQSNTTETGPATSTSGSQSNTTETGPATSTTSGSQSNTTETGPATSATSVSQSNTTETGPATSATSVSQASTSEASAPNVTSGTKPSFSETTEATDVSTTPAETNTNATEGGNSSTPTAKPETTKLTAIPPTTVKQHCTATSCGESFATCIDLYNYYICQCPLRYFFNKTDLSCTRGDSFYGNLQLSIKSFNPKKDSQEYTDLYNKVLDYFRTCFENETSYSDTVIADISEMSPKVQTRSTRQLVSVAVSCYHVFKQQTVTEAEVLDAINKYNASNVIGIYYEKNICDGFYCDSKTTNCIIEANSDPICTCKDKFFHTSSSLLTSCRDCDLNCEGEGKQCIWSDIKEKAICSCLPDYYSKDNSCEKCQFGYSGEECTNNSLLILVIVGSIAGAVVIALLGTVIGLSVRSSRRKHDNERTQLITKDSRDSPMSGNIFPKVQAKTDLVYVNQGSNAYDITDAYSRPNLKHDYDNDAWYEMSGRERSY